MSVSKHLYSGKIKLEDLVADDIAVMATRLDKADKHQAGRMNYLAEVLKNSGISGPDAAAFVRKRLLKADVISLDAVSPGKQRIVGEDVYVSFTPGLKWLWFITCQVVMFREIWAKVTIMQNGKVAFEFTVDEPEDVKKQKVKG
ncbi:hypothetical protein LCGC14_2876690 [marine sediment metagenome]|uniref:Uncharacterized protein n=1 Tax=marine sediment metagenome TaxID=412755 RepID=A0A0F8YN28_9ZZZZ